MADVKDEVEKTESKDDSGVKVVNPDSSTPDGYFKMVSQLHEQSVKTNESFNQLSKRMDDIMDSRKEVISKRPMLWSPADAGYDVKFFGDSAFEGNMDKFIDLTSNDGNIKYLQNMSDELLIIDAILKKKDHNYDIRESNHYKKFKDSVEGLGIKAMATPSGSAGNAWIPTNFSASLIETVKLLLRVGNLHERIAMTSKDYTLPVEGSDIFAYLIGESIADSSTSIPTATPSAPAVTLVSKKIGVRALLSTELEEDAIIKAMPYLMKKIARALAIGQEYMIINGDADGTRDNTEQDGTTIDGKSNLRAFDGYRKVTADISGVSIAAGGGFLTSGDHLRRARASMGKYGVDPRNIVHVTGTRGYLKHFLGIRPVQTIDKVGDIATIKTGVLGRFEGSDIVVSEWVREDLNATGVSGGVSSNTDTHITIVNKDAFVIGDRRQVTIKTEEIIDTDQVKIVATQRLAFKPVYTTGEKFISQVVNLE